MVWGVKGRLLLKLLIQYGAAKIRLMLYGGLGLRIAIILLFCSYVLAAIKSEDKIWKLVWNGIATPNVELFVWRLMGGRIATKVELIKRDSSIGGILRTDEGRKLIVFFQACGYCGTDDDRFCGKMVL
ncbi:hypothetical protein GOBAR_AA25152 [Gossypium barbadense]|uniref:Reverse transcriptase zinc-binding domain-containing protein n=1 Tax=Gossypium barbadense TaxID=3634 RepID=A0A2P5WWQ3_GOSBA|nr:hypothetical protein GOBAR_AA25152 [Gossypium barbadense]